jgi:hypothetical protein
MACRQASRVLPRVTKVHAVLLFESNFVDDSTLASAVFLSIVAEQSYCARGGASAATRAAWRSKAKARR